MTNAQIETTATEATEIAQAIYGSTWNAPIIVVDDKQATITWPDKQVATEPCVRAILAAIAA